MATSDEDLMLRSVALRNANSIFRARQAAEEELRQNVKALQLKNHQLAQIIDSLRATLDATSDGILVTDLNGDVSNFNAPFASMWGVRNEAVLSLDDIVQTKIVDPQSFLRRTQEINSWSPADSLDIIALRDQRTILRESRRLVIDGQTVGRVWSFRDISAARQADAGLTDPQQGMLMLAAERAARTEAERVNMLKDEFLVTLSHELRTPLSAILGWSQVLQMGSTSQQDLAEGLEAISRNARAQTQLIEDLLDINRIVSGKVRLDVQHVELAKVIEAAVSSVQPVLDAKSIRLLTIVDPLAGPVSGDPHRLQQIVSNLLSNAVKFTPDQGRIEVLVQRVCSHIEITVNDSGQGIAEEQLPHVFERFRQTDASTTRRHGGLGLGLSIVKQLVGLHGGDVTVRSDGLGRGTTFVVVLPLAAVRDAAIGEHPASTYLRDPNHAPVELEGIQILVVDDDRDARDLIKRVLMQFNASVITAANANDGLRLLQETRPDLLVSDIGMPEKDGYQFIREVRLLPAAQGGKTPAIALTAFTRSEDRTRAMISGYQIHMAKPIEPHELVATVASLARRDV